MNTKNQSPIIAVIAALAMTGGICHPTAAQASLALPKLPLFVNTSTTPNIFFQMDDSGSMDWDILTPTHFTTCRYNSKKSCTKLEMTGLFYDWSGRWRNGNMSDWETFEYVENSNDDVYDTGCYSDDRQVVEKCSSRTDGDSRAWDWRVRSADLNVLYFNPAIDYKPWPDYDDASFTAARSYPDSAQSSGYNDADNLSGFTYYHWIDDKGFSGSRPDKTDDTSVPNGIVDEWDSHVRVSVTTGGFQCTLISTGNVNSNGLNKTFTTLSAGDSRCTAALGVNTTAAELRQNVANWFQYYRRRNMVARASVANVITDLPSFRYGFGMINNTSLFVEMPAPEVNDYEDHNADLIESYLEHAQQAQGTPLRSGLDRIGKYYAGTLSGKDSPIATSCQKNFTMLFSDGFWNGSNAGSINSDVDGDNGVVFYDTDDETRVLLADVAKHYYDTDLSTKPDLVPTDQHDSASHQHMVTFTVGFGITGSLYDSDGDGWPNNLNNGAKWYTSGANDDERRVDDLWHAAWNSRGQYISAKRPEDLITKVKQAILDISDRVGGAASGATNGGSISSDSKVFQAKFDAADWHGSLLAINVQSSDGELGTIAWEAGSLLNQKSNSWFQSTRKVLTWDPVSHAGKEFKWSSITQAQKDLLDIHPVTSVDDDQGEKRLNYLRGVDSDEGTLFRTRTNRLGDIAHSDPEYVAHPKFYYSFGNYLTFANAKQNRPKMVYVGANDGMLHAFSESTGEEVFTYVPDMLMSKTTLLTDVDYDHEFYVDGAPIYGDIQSGSSWKSVLVGGLRAGGQGLYALDITDPGSIGTGNVMWEFSDADDADLGYFFGDPQIRKMANGKWAAIFTSGYNNTEVDDHVSSNGNQYVYIAFINEGTNGWSSGDFKKIHVPGADGLSAPAAADIDGDSIADFIYVGDLDGNMWKIDVTGTTTASWGVAFSGEPLFIAKDSSGDRQPITSRPAITRHPMGIREGVLVLFGTGKYIEINDDAALGAQSQSVYAIWDRDGYFNRALSEKGNTGDHGFARSNLNNPAMAVDPVTKHRVIHDYTPNTPVWYDEDGVPDSRGWYVDLPVEGERMVRNIILRDNIAFMVSMIPADDVCAAGGSGWLMALNAETGGAPRFPVIDINDDNAINENDVLKIDNPFDESNDDVLTNPIGIEMLSIPNLPALLYDDRPSDLSSPFPLKPNSARGCGSDGAKSFTYTTRTNGSVVMIAAAHQPLACGRQSWSRSH